MDKQTENLPILQDFVPYRGCCPASLHENRGNIEQGIGTTDHLMALGDWFIIRFLKTEETRRK